MCGIAGYLGSTPPDAGRVAACRALMRRRGPDRQDARSWTTPDGRSLLLLHARLSIIDLSERGAQPMRHGDTWIATNSELYNYIEVRAELEAEGVRFATDSDTEVLAAALDRWDVASALDRCEGMWAFAAYHAPTGRLVLSRDRFGEKPLYLHRAADGGLYFGSEVKFLAALAGRRFAVNDDQLHRYLVNGYRSLYKKPETFFREVVELPRATALVIEAGGEHLVRYWRPGAACDRAMRYDDAVAGVRERLMEAVRLRLRADVPLAFCMSGGVDSNALIGIAKKALGHDVHGFTIVNPDERYNETPLVDRVVGELGLRHTAVPVETRDFLPGLRVLVRQHDAPVYTISYFAQWRLHQAMAEHGYRIAVSGTAADELFTGYYDHHLFYLAALRDDPAALAEAAANWGEHVRPLVRNRLLRDPRAFIDAPERRDHLYGDSDLFRTYLVSDWHEDFTEERYAEEPLRNRMLNELFHEVIPQILHEDDLNAMYHSIENRSPFLDRRLFDFCQTVPTELLVRDGRAKAVLRDAVRGFVPDAVVDCRRKVGFNADILSYLDTGAPEVRDWILDDGPIYDRLQRPRIEALLAQPRVSETESKFLFCTVNAKMFLEEVASYA